jgi:phospholipase C
MVDLLKSDAPRKAMAMMLAIVTVLGPTAMPAFAAPPNAATATPIQHLVVIFQENVSFDHYFGTYPAATNPSDEPKFFAKSGTPMVNGLTNALLNFNPNLNSANGSAASNPFRLDRSQAVTPDQDHNYTAEQLAFDGGVMDRFPADTSSGGNIVMIP